MFPAGPRMRNDMRLRAGSYGLNACVLGVIYKSVPRPWGRRMSDRTTFEHSVAYSARQGPVRWEGRAVSDRE